MGRRMPRGEAGKDAARGEDGGRTSRSQGRGLGGERVGAIRPAPLWMRPSGLGSRGAADFTGGVSAPKRLAPHPGHQLRALSG